jgi:putative ABC transport system ATP-binding protein
MAFWHTEAHMLVLEISGLKKSFLGPDGQRTQVLDIPHFSLEAGAEAALRGASGSGKSTFLNIIAGILQADSGTVKVAGQEFTALPEAERDLARGRHIGYIFQTFNLLQGYTALENVLLGMHFGRGADRARAETLLEQVGLGERKHYRPRQLSIGQQQRVAVARALANKPELVLADEPTGNLDQRNAEEALALIRETCRRQGAALLLVSHAREILTQFEKVEELDALNRVGAANS